MTGVVYWVIPKCLELSYDLAAYRRGLPAPDGCPNHRQATSAAGANAPCVGPEWWEIRADAELDPAITRPRPLVLLSQGMARPGICYGQHWGRRR